MKDEPDTSTPLVKAWNSLKKDFHKNFIEKDRWKAILTGVWFTISLTILALLLGIIIGFIVALIRCTYLKTTKHGIILKILNAISQVYLTVIRGTPVVVQIMIIFFVIFLPSGLKNKFVASVICFGLNSGAYVAEIVRGGIMSIDNGQMEAGRSLGFNYFQTMYHIIFPQAFKAVLPALGNEFIVLLKETSVAFYIGLGDLMYAGNSIRAATYSAFMPLVTVALIYLVMVIGLSKLVGLLERRLRNSER
ncbi:MAG: amino acid ABC transporter permease [Clostridia bacterium]|nr:amino acid ABC transporter permease [Clostridia bacterium]